MTNVFLSYSRRDKIFTRRLFEALQAQKHNLWVDFEDIPYSAEWWQEIQRGIESADFFVAVVTPYYLRSQVCNQELAYAESLNKQIVPLIRVEIKDEAPLQAYWSDKDWRDQARANWGLLKRLNWLLLRRKDTDECTCDYDAEGQIINPPCDAPFCDEDNFDETLAKLNTVLTTDLEHLRAHTRLLERAIEWESNNRRNSFLLRGEYLSSAEAWLAQSAQKRPKATQLQTEYILAGRAWQTRQVRTLLTLAVMGLAAMALLSILAFRTSLAERRARAASEQNRATAVFAQATAQRNAEESNSLALASLARQLYINDGDPITGLAFAMQANAMLAPPFFAQKVLAEIAYASQVRARVIVDKGAAGATLGVQAVFNAEATRVAEYLENTGDLVAYDLNTGGLLWSVESPPIVQLAWMGEFVLAIDASGAVFLHQGWDGLPVGQPLKGLGIASTDVAISPDETLAYLPVGNLVRIISLDPDFGLVERSRFLIEEIPAISALAVDPSGELLLVGAPNGVFALYDLVAQETVSRFEETLGAAVTDVAFSPQGNYMALVFDTGLSVSMALPQVLEGQSYFDALLFEWASEQPLYSLDLVEGVRDGGGVLMAASGLDNEIELYDLVNGGALSPFTGHRGPVMALRLLSDGQSLPSLLSAGADGWVLRWSFDYGALSAYLFPPDEEKWTVTNAFFGADSHKVTVIYGPRFNAALPSLGPSQAFLRVVFDTTTGQEIHGSIAYNQSLRTAEGDILLAKGVALASTRAANFRRGGVIGRLYNPQTGDLLVELVGQHSEPISGAALSPDGAILATASSDDTLVLWEVANGAFLRRLRGHTGEVTAVAFHPNLPWLASAGLDEQTILWDIATGQEVRRFPPFYETSLTQRGAALLVFSPDGRYLLLGLRDGFAYIWRVDSLAELRTWASTQRVIEDLNCSTLNEYGVIATCE